MPQFIEKDTEGKPYFVIRPHQIGIGAIITVLVFVFGIIYAASTKASEVKTNKSNIVRLENRVEKIEEALSGLSEMKTDIKWIKKSMEDK